MGIQLRHRVTIRVDEAEIVRRQGASRIEFLAGWIILLTFVRFVKVAVIRHEKIVVGGGRSSRVLVAHMLKSQVVLVVHLLLLAHVRAVLTAVARRVVSIVVIALPIGTVLAIVTIESEPDRLGVERAGSLG